jgi:hypothetical protein
MRKRGTVRTWDYFSFYLNETKILNWEGVFTPLNSISSYEIRVC